MKITFNINFYTVWGQKLYMVGSIPELGTWQTGLAKEMNYIGDGNWQLRLEVSPSVKQIEYRYFLSENNQQMVEEWEKNHRIILDKQSEIYTLYDYWQTRPDNVAFYSSAFTKSLFAHPCNPYERIVQSRKKLIIKVFAPRVDKNQSVAITGNRELLGDWQPGKALVLSCDTFPEWSIELDAEGIDCPFEYKFLVVETHTRQLCYWESGDNRVLHLMPSQEGETICISGLCFQENLPLWRTTGTVIPVFSLRSENSFGVGDLRDLHLFVDWVKQTGQRIIQVLPVNDTTATHTWMDSYPYSAISIYALHPMYISLSWLGNLTDREKASFFEAKQKELNNNPFVDYESVVKYKNDYCRLFFEQEGKYLLETPEYQEFFSANDHWLKPYAAYSYFRDKYNTTDFSKWDGDATYSPTRINRLCRENSEAWAELSFTFFQQYVLHTQFKSVAGYARKNGIVLKGDIPIGVNRNSVEVWTEPEYFNMNGQTGAPPDDFSTVGQNWMFPTYNWVNMENDGFNWWRKRFKKLDDYFDSFRIDHILGFFRIWEIPEEFVQGLCGHFNPALPLSKEEIEHYGMEFNEARLTTAHINRQYLPELFGEWADKVKNTYLAQSSSNHFVLKPFCDTQKKIRQLFEHEVNDDTVYIRDGLYAIANEVLFLRDPSLKDRFHPRISASQSCLYRELSNSDRYAFDRLYWDFFYRRHNDFWKVQAFKRLTPLIASTQMLVCGEDLGMIPESVPEVMNKLQILSLEIERMPKEPGREFSDLENMPYLSVCTTSTHDMSPLRNWWKEDQEKTQRYYNDVLQRSGSAPEECSSDVARQIMENHLNTPSMLAIIPLQDWFGMDDTVKQRNYESERINEPANPTHYWRYRMHVTIEDLMKADSLNKKVISIINESGRK
ncbi:MAG: 4-alpha-glucanotransferase [Tannerellaceae bacterium]|jgi:4-alpha-glucanotransferase|nr:4-alpha-glucanotransferase [Tannerellaceae bacterium]